MKNEKPQFEDAAAVMRYLATRFDKIEQATTLLVKQRAERRYPIAAQIRTEVSRARWALTFVTGATDTTERCAVCKVGWVDTAAGEDTCASCQVSA